MSVSIFKNNNEFSINVISIVDWEIMFNSKHYLIIDIIFNSDLNKIESDYTGISNESVLVNLYENVTGILDTLTYSSRTQTNNNLDTPASITNYIVNNNKLRVIFDYLTSGFLLDTGSIDKYLEFIIHSGDTTEKTFNTNSDNNQSGVGDREIEEVTINSYTLSTPNTLTSISESHNINSSAIRFNNSDRLLIYPSGDSSKGLLSDNINSIVHESNSPNRDSDKGYVYESTASFDFSHSYSGGLSTNLTYTVNSNSILAKIDKSLTSDDILFDPNIDEVISPIDNNWDTISLSSSSSSGSTHTIYIPVLKDFITSDGVLITVNFDNFVNMSSINGVSDNNTINNGECSFSLSFPPTGYIGSESGTINITSDNGLNISKTINLTST